MYLNLGQCSLFGKELYIQIKAAATKPPWSPPQLSQQFITQQTGVVFHEQNLCAYGGE